MAQKGRVWPGGRRWGREDGKKAVLEPGARAGGQQVVGTLSGAVDRRLGASSEVDQVLALFSPPGIQAP